MRKITFTVGCRGTWVGRSFRYGKARERGQAMIPMKHRWMRGAAALATGAALGLGACSDVADLPDAVALIDVDGVKPKDIAKRFVPEATQVSETEMQAALDMMRQNEIPVSWETAEFGDNRVTLSGLETVGMRVDRLTLQGLRLGETGGLQTIAYDAFEAENTEIIFEDYVRNLEEVLGEELMGEESPFGLTGGDRVPDKPSDIEIAEMEIPPPDSAPEGTPTDAGDVDDALEDAETSADSEVEVFDLNPPLKLARIRIASSYGVEGMSPVGEEAVEAMVAMMESGQLTRLPTKLGPFVMSGVSFIDEADTTVASLESVAFADSEPGTRNGFFDMDGLEVSWNEMTSHEVIPHAVTLEEVSAAGFPALGRMMDGLMAFSARMAALEESGEMPLGDPIAFDREAVLDGLLLPYRHFAVKSLDYSGPFKLTMPALSYAADRKRDRITVETRMDLTVDASDSEAEVRDSFMDVLDDDSFDLNLGYTTRLDVAEDSMVQVGRASMPGGFSLDYEYGAEGYVVLMELYADMMEALMSSSDPEKALGGMAMQSFAILDAYRIAKLDLKFADEGLYKHLSDKAAEDEGLEPDAYRAKIAGDMRTASEAGLASSPIPTAIMGDVVDAASAFLETPGSTFRVVIAPKEPVTLMGLMSLSPERLGFSAETSP